MNDVETAIANQVDQQFRPVPRSGGTARQKLLDARIDTSGDAAPVPTKHDLPPSNLKEFEASMLHYQRLAVDNERLEKEVAHLKDTMAREIGARDVKIQVLNDTRNDIQVRINECLAQRDQAVAERAVYETLFVSVVAQFAAFKIPTVPLAVETDVK
jgi:hypothetical protein